MELHWEFQVVATESLSQAALHLLGGHSGVVTAQDRPDRANHGDTDNGRNTPQHIYRVNGGAVFERGQNDFVGDPANDHAGTNDSECGEQRTENRHRRGQRVHAIHARNESEAESKYRLRGRFGG